MYNLSKIIKSLRRKVGRRSWRNNFTDLFVQIQWKLFASLCSLFFALFRRWRKLSSSLLCHSGSGVFLDRGALVLGD